MILTVGATKGGVGKTTLALNLALSASIAGKRVLLIDADRQGTATSALAIRNQANRMPHLPVLQETNGKALQGVIDSKRGEFDSVVIDAGGRDSTALRAALVLSDAVLIPFAPRSLDVWALGDMAALVAEARTARSSELKAWAVLSGADTIGTDNKDAAAAVSNFPELTYIDAPIRRRKSVAIAAGSGLAVQELRPKDSKAIAEINVLVSIIKLI